MIRKQTKAPWKVFLIIPNCLLIILTAYVLIRIFLFIEIMYSTSKFTQPSIYQNSSYIYNLQDYPIGCRLKKRSPSVDFINRDYYYPYLCPSSNICYQPNYHEICCCSYQYRLNCCQKPLPSLCHKLLSAPYTKYAPIKKKSKRTKQTQTQPQPSTAQQVKKPKSPIKQKQVAFQPIYKNQEPLPIQQVVYQTIPRAPNIPQSVNLYQQPIPQQVIYQAPVFIKPQVPETSNNAISFRTIPVQNTAHSIKNLPSHVFYPQQVPNPQMQSRKILSKPKIPNRTSLMVYDENSRKEISVPSKEENQGLFILPIKNQNKENLMPQKNQIINVHPQNTLSFQNGNYTNLNQGQVLMQNLGMQRNFSVSQNQQIQQQTSSFSSSQSEMKSSIQRSTKTSQFQQGQHRQLKIEMKKEDEEQQNESLSESQK